MKQSLKSKNSLHKNSHFLYTEDVSSGIRVGAKGREEREGTHNQNNF